MVPLIFELAIYSRKSKIIRISFYSNKYRYLYKCNLHWYSVYNKQFQLDSRCQNCRMSNVCILYIYISKLNTHKRVVLVRCNVDFNFHTISVFGPTSQTCFQPCLIRTKGYFVISKDIISDMNIPCYL